MSAREIPGYLDYKNALNVARWRVRFAMTQGKDLIDLRSNAQLHIAAWATDNSMPQLDWAKLDRPTCKRVKCKKTVRASVSIFHKRQAA